MAENQHRQISGYRDFDKETISKINAIKEKGNELEKMIAEAREQGADEVWVHEAEMALKKGTMYLVRSIAKPKGF